MSIWFQFSDHLRREVFCSYHIAHPSALSSLCPPQLTSQETATSFSLYILLSSQAPRWITTSWKAGILSDFPHCSLMSVFSQEEQLKCFLMKQCRQYMELGTDIIM